MEVLSIEEFRKLQQKEFEEVNENFLKIYYEQCEKDIAEGAPPLGALPGPESDDDSSGGDDDETNGESDKGCVPLEVLKDAISLDFTRFTLFPFPAGDPRQPSWRFVSRFRNMFDRVYLIFTIAGKADKQKCKPLLRYYYETLIKGGDRRKNPVMYRVVSTSKAISDNVTQLLRQHSWNTKTATILYVDRHTEHPVLDTDKIKSKLARTLEKLFENWEQWREQIETDQHVIYLPASVTAAFADGEIITYATNTKLNQIFSTHTKWSESEHACVLL